MRNISHEDDDVDNVTDCRYHILHATKDNLIRTDKRTIGNGRLFCCRMRLVNVIERRRKCVEWTVVISVASAISGILLGWLGKAKAHQQEAAQEASKDATLKSDVDYIKRGIDDLRLEQKDQGRRFDQLAERVTRVEEAAKQAHHRLNRLDGGV